MVAIGRLAIDDTPAPRTCRHLAPLERLLADLGLPLGGGRPCPHDADWGIWHTVDAALYVRGLTRRLALDPCVTVEAYVGVMTRGDVTFYCQSCKHAIVGRHPGTDGPAVG
jgi:hypothetical protein